MAKMHPDDVNARDWEFMLSDRFPSAPSVSYADEWAQAEFPSNHRVAHLRAALVNAWPDDCETIEPWVIQLEDALDAAFRLKEPAVSIPLRGESENAPIDPYVGRSKQVSPARSKHGRERLAPTKEIHVDQNKRKCAMCRKHVPKYNSAVCGPCARELGIPRDASNPGKATILRLRLNRSIRRFDALDIQAEGVVKGDQIGVRLVSWNEPRWHIQHNTVMTLTESELWLDHMERWVHNDTDTRFPL